MLQVQSKNFEYSPASRGSSMMRQERFTAAVDWLFQNLESETDGQDLHGGNLELSLPKMPLMKNLLTVSHATKRAYNPSDKH